MALTQRNWKDWRIVAAATGAVVLLVALAALAGVAVWRSTPSPVQIAQIACGVPRETVSLELPGDLLAASQRKVPVWLGPIPYPSNADMIRLKFSLDADGTGTAVIRIDDVLHLPIHLGDAADPPERILLHCRDDEVARVQYRSRAGVVKDFPVVRRMVADHAPGRD